MEVVFEQFLDELPRVKTFDPGFTSRHARVHTGRSRWTEVTRRPSRNEGIPQVATRSFAGPETIANWPRFEFFSSGAPPSASLRCPPSPSPLSDCRAGACRRSGTRDVRQVDRAALVTTAANTSFHQRPALTALEDRTIPERMS
jgi:hypothetical protein